MTDFRVLRRALHSLLAAVLCVIPGTGQASASVSSIGALDCVINPSVVADLGSSAPGILASVSVDRSDFVTAGDVIAELESGVESASVELAKTRADSTAEVDLRRVNAAYGYRLRKRTKDLFQRNVVSTNDLDERETEARLARIQLRQAVDNQAIAKLELARAEEILKRRTIKSPITGVVMERFKVVGEYVEDQPVARVAQLDPLHVEVIIPVEHLGKVTAGMTAEVWTEVVEGDRWNAEVTRVDKVADVASGTYGVRLALPNPEYKIPAGLRCQMQLVDSAAQPVAVENEAPTTVESPVAEAEIAEPEAARPPTPSPRPVAERPSIDEQKAAAPRPEIVLIDRAAETRAEDPPTDRAMEEAPTASATLTNKRVTDEPPPRVKQDVKKADAPVDLASEKRDRPVIAEPGASEPVDPAPVADATGPESTVADEPPACRVAGPFRDEVVATRKVVKLRRAGLSVDIKSIARGRRVELKIMTPVLENHTAAQAVITKMKKAGLSDYYLHKMPAGKRRVYLGIYNSKHFADIRLRELSDAGIKAFSRPSKDSGLNYFLVIRGAPQADVAQMVSRLPITQDDEADKLGFCDKLAGR